MTAARRALLIGSQTHGLECVEADVEKMSMALRRRGFAVTTRIRGDATRAGIIKAYERLIAETQPGDAVCVYYSGHGGRAENPYGIGPRYLQYLVPTDHGPGSFRGVMSFELSGLLAQLTQKTLNVTVILDCCHSGQMSRGGPATPVPGATLIAKGVAEELSEGQLKALVDVAQARQLLADAESNPYALRLMATEPTATAYEDKRDGVAGGIFTEALLAAIERRENREASWGSVMLEVREQVMQEMKDQRPDVEGPRRRRLFELDLLPDERPLPLFFEGTEARLRGGALLGAIPGSRYGVMPAGSERYVAETALAEAVVTDSLGSTSRLEIRAPEHRPLPASGCLAFPLEVNFHRLAVGLGAELSPELGGLFANSRYLLAQPIEPAGALPTVRQRAGELELRDAQGLLLARAPEAAPAALLERLECVARAEHLRMLDDGLLMAGPLQDTLIIEYGRVEDGRCIRHDETEPLHVGDRQYVKLVNDGYKTLYVAVLAIDAKYSVRLLSRRAPRGQMLRPDDPLEVGKDSSGQWRGTTRGWPDSLSEETSQRETLVVIAADEEQDFSLLLTSDAYDLKLAHQPAPPGGRGKRGEPEAVEVREPGREYKLARIDYRLDPTPRPG